MHATNAVSERSLANVYTCLYVYTSDFFLYLVLHPVSLTARFSSNEPSPTCQLPNGGILVCLAS